MKKNFLCHAIRAATRTGPRFGIFAQRNKDRPKPPWLDDCQHCQREGRSLLVKGLDAVNKHAGAGYQNRFFAEFLPRETIRQPEWSHELMKDYWD